MRDEFFRKVPSMRDEFNHFYPSLRDFCRYYGVMAITYGVAGKVGGSQY